ncbi:chromosome partitioning protein ParB [Shewanella colwelliana]|uniref:Chromosome partitioning protein ParB n=1 Tax=Shewanella colwelliana TaxID=23 RepID=A0ABQ4P0E3_SHECO|nr:ParB N-terminal domain-containing protein [Shewanella colwelliana]GIU40981.1 chromosome partitioning protein ParB [Shewanella colwelliana]
MRNKRTALGRSVDLSMADVPVSHTKEYTLLGGRKVKFTATTIAANLLADTVKPHELNLRLPEELTRASLASMIETIKDQQFYPAICQKVGDVYYAMDGSRRRQAALFAGAGFDILYTESDLSVAEVKHLTKQLQTAKEHSLRERGKQYYGLMNPEQPEGEDTPAKALTQTQIAEVMGVSQGYVSNALKAWSIPQSLISLYEYPSDIIPAEFNKLASVVAVCEKKGMDIDEFAKSVDIQPGTKNDEVTTFIVEAAKVKKPKAKQAVKFAEVNSKKWAKEKIDKDKITLTLNRVTKDEYSKIQSYIKDVMEGRA